MYRLEMPVDETGTQVTMHDDDGAARDMPPESLLQEVQDLARVGNWRWLLREDVFFWSAGMFPLYGLPPGSAAPTPRGFVQMLHPDDRAGYLALVKHSMRVGGTFEHDHRILTPQGEVRHIAGVGRVRTNAAGRPVDVIGTAQDVTARKEHAESVAYSERLHRLMVDRSPVAIALLDGTGRCVRANDAMLELLGRARDEVVGRVVPHLDVYGGNGVDAERLLRRGDGSARWVEVHTTELPIAPGEENRRLVHMIDHGPRTGVDAPAGPDLAGLLTVREREVLVLIVSAMTNRRIASTLGISERTAEHHVSSLLRKLGAASRTEAGVIAVRGGLVPRPRRAV